MTDWQERLVEAVTARGISGGELGRRSGFSAQYINSLRTKERGGRLPHDTARRLAHALGVSVEWLISGTGPRERLSDTYPIYMEGPPESGAPVPAGAPSSPGSQASPASQRGPGSQTSPRFDRYPSRAEAIALLATTVEPEVVSALREVVLDDPEADPGREHWIAYARDLVRDLRRIKTDPLLNGRAYHGDPAPQAQAGGPQDEAAASAPGDPPALGAPDPHGKRAK